MTTRRAAAAARARPSPPRLMLLLLPLLMLLAALAPPAAGFRYFLARLPNGNAVPAVGSQPGATNGICEAWGHEKCAGHDDTEPIGEAFRGSKADRRSSSFQEGQWRVDFCAADSDSDGEQY